jgi:hypothetical protein
MTDQHPQPPDGTSADKLWQNWIELDRAIGEADERAHKETGGAFDLYKARRDEFQAELLAQLNEIEEQIANMVPVTIEEVLVQLRLLNERWTSEPEEIDGRLVANLLAGLEGMAAGRGSQ